MRRNLLLALNHVTLLVNLFPRGRILQAVCTRGNKRQAYIKRLILRMCEFFVPVHAACRAFVYNACAYCRK